MIAALGLLFVTAVFTQEGGDLLGALLQSQCQRGGTIFVPGIDVRAGVDQKFDHFFTGVISRVMQRCVLIIVQGIDGGSIGDEKFNHFNL